MICCQGAIFFFQKTWWGQLCNPEQDCLDTLCFNVPFSKMGQLWFSHNIDGRVEHAGTHHHQSLTSAGPAAALPTGNSRGHSTHPPPTTGGAVASPTETVWVLGPTLHLSRGRDKRNRKSPWGLAQKAFLLGCPSSFLFCFILSIYSL